MTLRVTPTLTLTRLRPRRALIAFHVLAAGLLMAASTATAMQVLDAVDNAELAAEISATGVSRITLGHDRIVRVVRSPDGFAVEHDAATGDLYLRPAVPQPGTAAAESSGPGVEGMPVPDPVTLFIGTERGFTYRLALAPTARDSAQVLIRNADAIPAAVTTGSTSGGDPHVAALVRLVRAVARRESLPGHEILAGGGNPAQGIRIVEPGGVRGFRRSCWRRTPSPRLQAAAPLRALPGPCRKRWPRVALRRSGWRVRTRARTADGSRWRWSRPPDRESRDERPQRIPSFAEACPGRRRRRRRPAAPAAAVLRDRRGPAGRPGRLARRGRRRGAARRRAASRPGSWSRTRPRGSGRYDPRQGSAGSRRSSARWSGRRGR